MQDLKHIIESLLFVADETLTVDKIRGIVESADPKAIRDALQELAADYDERGGGFYLCEVAGGYQLRSRPIYHEYLKRLLQPSPQRLSRAALETLSVVAYRQPIIRADIEHIRGVDCGAMLRQLMERKLIRVLGRKEIPGRPLIYATTKSFLELFELKDLSELPTPAEIEQIRAAIDDTSADIHTASAVTPAEVPTEIHSSSGDPMENNSEHNDNPTPAHNQDPTENHSACNDADPIQDDEKTA